MRKALLLLLGVMSACSSGDDSSGDEPPPVEASPGVRVECFVPNVDCTTSYQLAMEAVDPRFSPGVVHATVRETEVRLCPYGDPRYDVALIDDQGQSIEITIALMPIGKLIACTY